MDPKNQIPPAKGEGELLPCPFCGGEDISIRTYNMREEHAYCRACDVDGPPSDGPLDGKGTRAIAVWNHRAPTASPTDAPTGAPEDPKTALASSPKSDGWREGQDLGGLIERLKDASRSGPWRPTEHAPLLLKAADALSRLRKIEEGVLSSQPLDAEVEPLSAGSERAGAIERLRAAIAEADMGREDDFASHADDGERVDLWPHEMEVNVEDVRLLISTLPKAVNRYDELMAALGEACVGNGLADYDENGEMRFQPPVEAFRDEIARLEGKAENASIYWRRETKHAEFAEGQAQRYREALERILRLDTLTDRFGSQVGQAGRVAAEALEPTPSEAATPTDQSPRPRDDQDTLSVVVPVWPSIGEIQKAGWAWRYDKERETDSDDQRYFEHNWHSQPGLGEYVTAEIKKRPEFSAPPPAPVLSQVGGGKGTSSVARGDVTQEGASDGLRKSEGGGS